MDSTFVILFYAILLTPIGFVIGLLVWIIGAFAKGNSEQPHPAQTFGKKMMLFSLVVFLVGAGSCWGLLGIESLVSDFLGYN